MRTCACKPLTYTCILMSAIRCYLLLVFCLTAGPWLPTSPSFSILSLPLHYIIRFLYQILKHSYSLPSSSSLSFHASFPHLQHQTITSQNMTHPVLFAFEYCF